MLGLEAVGILEKTPAFVENEVSTDLLSNFSITIRHREPFYLELLEPLRKRGRQALVNRIREKLEQN